MEKFGAVSTISVAFPVRLEAVHEMVVVPGATAVATPVDALMVAILGLLLAQPDDVQAGMFVPDELVACAVNGTVVPTAAPTVDGDTNINEAENTKMLVPSGPTMTTCWPLSGVWAQHSPESTNQKRIRLMLVTYVESYFDERGTHRGRGLARS